MSAAGDHRTGVGLPAAPSRAPEAARAGSAIYGGHRLEISRELLSQWLRLAGSLRQALHACVRLDAPPGRVRELADRAAEIARDLSAHAGGRPVPLAHPEPERLAGDALNATLPFSPVMGRYNPLAPPVDLARDGDGVVGTVRLGEAHQGFAGVAHGGVVAAIFDEVLATAAIAAGLAGATASLRVDYREPTPLFEPLRFEARIDRAKARRVQVRGRCLWDGRVLSEAQATFVRPAAGRFLRRGGDGDAAAKPLR